jgi:hypothetical protein
MTKITLVLLASVLTFSARAEEKFKPLTEEQLARYLERMCSFKLLTWFGDTPPVVVDLTGKKPTKHEAAPIFSKEFDKKYYEILKKKKDLGSEKSYEAAKKGEAKLQEEFDELIRDTAFFKTCKKITKKVASACVKNQETEEDLKKCMLFYQNKFEILNRHNGEIMEIPELKKKAETDAKWLDE